MYFNSDIEMVHDSDLPFKQVVLWHLKTFSIDNFFLHSNKLVFFWVDIFSDGLFWSSFRRNYSCTWQVIDHEFVVVLVMGHHVIAIAHCWVITRITDDLALELSWIYSSLLVLFRANCCFIWRVLPTLSGKSLSPVFVDVRVLAVFLWPANANIVEIVWNVDFQRLYLAHEDGQSITFSVLIWN